MEYLTFNETHGPWFGTEPYMRDILSVELDSSRDATFNSSTKGSTGTNGTADGSESSPAGRGVQENPYPRLIGILFLMVCTIAGNIILIVAITYKRSRRIKRVNIFLVNLAISDLAVATITMTSEILFIAFGEWVLGPALCKLSVYLEIVTLAAATFLLTAMSIDRYQVIVKPLQSLTNRPKIWTKVAVAWCLAFVFAIPQIFIFMQVRETEEPHQRACKSKGYKAEWQRKLYFTFLTCYILIIPTIVMTFCYLKIMKVIWSRAGGLEGGKSAKAPVSPRMSVNRNLVSSSRRKVVILTLTVIIGFLVCLTPYFVVSLVRIYTTYRIKLTQYLPFTEMIFMLHSALNPILFGIFTLRLEHLSCLVPKMCKTCFIDSVKTKATSPHSSGQDRNDVKMRLMSNVTKQRSEVTNYSGGQSAIMCRCSGENVRNQALDPENNKLDFCKPVLDKNVLTDKKTNGQIPLNLKRCEDVTEKKSAKSSGRESGGDSDVTGWDYPSVHMTSDRERICNDLNREVTEYVSCV